MATGFAWTARKLRVWGMKSALSLMDQGLTSAAGFGINLFLARWMPADVYGAFALAFAGFLFVSGFHNVLLLEPLSVMGPSRHATNLPAYFRAQLVIHAVLVGTLSVFVLLAGLVFWRLAPQSPLAGAVIGSGIVLPFFLLLWLVRRMCYVLQQPSAAVLGSGFYFPFILTGLFVLRHFGRVSPFTTFLLMGCGSLFGTYILLGQLGLRKRRAPTASLVSWSAVLQENWTYGRWLVGSTVCYSVSTQTQAFLAAGILGLGAAGILRAMQLPSLVMTQVSTATGLLVLPSLSYDFGCGSIERTRHKALVVSLGLSGMAFLYVVALALAAGRAEHLLFGGKYAAYAWLMPVLALIPLTNSIATGCSMALRASQKPQFVLLSNIIAAPVAVISAFLFMRWWGLAGAAASMVLSFATMSGVTIACFRGHKWDYE
jgi:O-antigen/teichoic acid export membrane protein